MAEERYGLPYIWISWLADACSGDQLCAYAPWFKAHFKYDKVIDARFEDSTAWNAKHDDEVARVADEFKASGYYVLVESQTKFTLRGRTALIGGKADVVAAKDDDLVVLDVKGGQQKKAHNWQVLGYLYSMPLALQQFRGCRFRGELRYSKGTVRIPAESLTKDVLDRMFGKVQEIARMSPPPTMASPVECSRCSISKDDCSARDERAPIEVEVEDF